VFRGWGPFQGGGYGRGYGVPYGGGYGVPYGGVYGGYGYPGVRFRVRSLNGPPKPKPKHVLDLLEV